MFEMSVINLQTSSTERSITTPFPSTLVMSATLQLQGRTGNVSTRYRATASTSALAGLRANEARDFKNKYDHVFTVEPASNAKPTIGWVHRILKEERDIVISSRPLEATAFEVENIRIAYVFYESGLSINVMYTIDGPTPKR